MKFELMICLIITFVNGFDPSKIDYCKLDCLVITNHSSACKDDCIFEKDREELMDDPEKFRQAILDAHNDMRNKIARGDEKKRLYPAAGNMLVLNYDLELEHVARCYIMSKYYQGDHDRCRQVSYCNGTSGPVQNLHGLGEKGDMVEQVKQAVNRWYEGDIEAIPAESRIDIVDNSLFSQNWGHFTTVVWARLDLVGCVRVWIPNLKPKEPYLKKFRLTIACNYAYTKFNSKYNICGANARLRPVYISGRPCSTCPDGMKCNKDTPGGKYDALCGEIRPVPKDKPEDIEHSAVVDKKGDAARIIYNKMLLALPVFAVAINYNMLMRKSTRNVSSIPFSKLKW